jgi:hypothetical protein
MVVVTALGTIISTILQDYYYALQFWYFELGTDHFNLQKQEHYWGLRNFTFNFVGGFACLCCIESTGFLSGTIYWVHRMTLNSDSTDFKAGALNLYTVFGHILLLMLQCLLVYFNVVSQNTTNYSL